MACGLLWTAPVPTPQPPPVGNATPTPPAPPAPTPPLLAGFPCRCDCRTWDDVTPRCVQRQLFRATFAPIPPKTATRTLSVTVKETRSSSLQSTVSLSKDLTASKSWSDSRTVRPPTRTMTPSRSRSFSDVASSSATLTLSLSLTRPVIGTRTTTKTLSPPPTRTPTVTFIPGLPPRPSALALALDALGTSTAVQDLATYVTAISSALAAAIVVTHATKGANVARIAQVVDCGFSEHWLKPPVVDVVYNAPVGLKNDRLKYLKGAILTSLFLALFPQMVTVTLLHWMPYRVRVRSVCGVVSVIFFAYFLPSAVGPSVLVVLHAATELDRLLGALGIVTCALALACPMAALTKMPSVYLAFRMFDRGARSYDKLVIRFYVLEDVGVAMLVAAIIACGPNDMKTEGCVGVGVAAAAVLLCHLLYLVWLHPYQRALQNAFALLLATGQLVLAVLSTAAATTPSMLRYVGVAALVQMSGVFVQLVVMFLWFAVKKYRRRFHGQEAKPSWLDIEEELTEARYGPSPQRLKEEAEAAQQGAEAMDKLRAEKLRRRTGLLQVPERRAKKKKNAGGTIDVDELIPPERRPKAACGPTSREVLRGLHQLHAYESFGHGVTVEDIGAQYNFDVRAVSPAVMAAVAGPQAPMRLDEKPRAPSAPPPPLRDNPLDVSMLSRHSAMEHRSAPTQQQRAGGRKRSDRFRPAPDNDEEDTDDF
jgi:hypothetical protein